MPFMILGIILLGAMIGAVIESMCLSKEDRQINEVGNDVFYKKFLETNKLNDSESLRKFYIQKIYGE